MKIKESIGCLVLVLAALAFMAKADGPWSVVSENPAQINTMSFTAATPTEVEDLDTRTYTESLSPVKKLNTKKIIGTIMLMR
ncbi:MAG: hypothetical protein PHU80_00845 [Kiritimatiellae bacterium]|nr:hypothetical protein [Kiritimatiellia bacterium]